MDGFCQHHVARSHDPHPNFKCKNKKVAPQCHHHCSLTARHNKHDTDEFPKYRISYLSTPEFQRMKQYASLLSFRTTLTWTAHDTSKIYASVRTQTEDRFNTCGRPLQVPLVKKDLVAYWHLCYILSNQGSTPN